MPETTPGAESPLHDNLQALLRTARAGEPTEVIGVERHYVVRAAPGFLPVRLPMSMAVRECSRVIPVLRSPTGEVEVRATGDEGAATEVEADKTATAVLQGTASSTSEDWYGTDFSQTCLAGMSEQMNRGVSIFPRHGGWLDRVEWNDEIGVTTEGQVQRSAVINPVEGTDPTDQYVLKMTGDLWVGASELAEQLANRLEIKAALEKQGKAGQRIGLSIGGWFLEIRYITDEEGDLIRICVEQIELDHVAVVRSPANPDSDDLKLIRSTWAEGARAKPVAAPPVERSAAVVVAPVVAPVETSPESEGAAAVAERGIPDPGAAAGDGANVRDVTAPPVVDVTTRESETPTHETGGIADRSEVPMTEEEKAAQDLKLREMIAEGIRSAIPTIALAVRDALPAPAAATTTTVVESPELIAMRSRAETAEREVGFSRRALAAQASTGQRVGRGIQELSNSSEEIPHEIRAVIAEAREKGQGTALCALVERSIDTLAVDMNDTSDVGFSKAQRAKRGALDLLGSVCRAAERDGILTNPYESAKLPAWS